MVCGRAGRRAVSAGRTGTAGTRPLAGAAGEADWVLLASALLAAVFAPLAIRLYRCR